MERSEKRYQIVVKQEMHPNNGAGKNMQRMPTKTAIKENRLAINELSMLFKTFESSFMLERTHKFSETEQAKADKREKELRAQVTGLMKEWEEQQHVIAMLKMELSKNTETMLSIRKDISLYKQKISTLTENVDTMNQKLEPVIGE